MSLHHALRPSALAGLLAAAAVLGGCTVHTRTRGTVVATGSVRVTTPKYVTVNAAPPPLRAAVTVRPARTRASAIWVAGYWSWEGRWVWVDGHWATPPSSGYIWEPPVVVAVYDGGYQYHRGYWRPRDRQPPAVYRADGTIRVHVHVAGEPARANRVVVRQGEPPPRRVVVRTGSRQGSSSTVVVRPHPNGNARGNANGTVRVRTNNGRDDHPGRGNANGTVRVRTNNGRDDHPGRGNANGTVRVRTNNGNGNNGRGDGTVRVRTQPDRDDRGNRGNQGRGNEARERDDDRGNRGNHGRGNHGRGNDDRGNRSNNGRGNNGRGRGNSASAPQAQPQRPTATAMTTVRQPATARPTTATAMTTVRQPATAQRPTTTAMTSVRPASPGGASAGAAPTATGRSCSLQVAALPRNGVLVIRGSGLAAATGVRIGTQAVPMLDKRDDRVRARVQGRANGGSVSVLFGSQAVSCGSVRITGR